MVMMILVFVQGCWEAANPLKAANVEFICFPRCKNNFKVQAGRGCLQRSCLRPLRSAWCGVSSPLLRSLNYLDNEKLRKSSVLLFRRSKNKISSCEARTEALDEGRKVQG